MYSWLIFLHVLSVFAFLFAHGASAMVMFKVRAEREPVRIRALLDLSNGVGGAMALTALLLLLTGLVAGFMGSWWGRGWIWASLGLFLAISVAMSFLGRPYFERVRHALGVPASNDQKKTDAALQPVPPEQLAAVLASGRVWLLAVVGLGGLAIITWLMMLKPF